jgi:4-hydroxy-tetrahydrodipicolinate synthase
MLQWAQERLCAPDMTEFQRLFVAAVTPRSPEGEVNMGAAFELIDFLCAAKVGGIALFTNAGEYPAFNPDERSRLVYLAVKRSRVPVLVGVGSATLDVSVNLAREAREAGASAVLVPPPLLFASDPDDLMEFFGEFCARVGGGIPVFAAGAEDWTTVADSGLLKNDIHGLVDATPVATLLGRLEPGRLLFSHESAFHRARSSGAGILSATACAVPELLMSLDRAMCASQYERLDTLDRTLRELLDWTYKFPTPVLLKTATELRGIKVGPLAVPMSTDKQKLLAHFREWFKNWLPGVQQVSAHA